MQEGVSQEALEVGGLISRVLIKPIRAATTKVDQGILGSGGGWGGGGFWGKACRDRHMKGNVINTLCKKLFGCFLFLAE